MLFFPPNYFCRCIIPPKSGNPDHIRPLVHSALNFFALSGKFHPVRKESLPFRRGKNIMVRVGFTPFRNKISNRV